MNISVLVLKLQSGEEHELDQRLNEDYISAFAPDLVDLKRRYGFNNAYIVPVEHLLEDQIELLKSRGAFLGKADVLKAEYTVRVGDFKSLRDHPMRHAAWLDYVCVFNRYVENRQTWLEAYTVSQHMPMGLQHSMFRMSYGFGLTGNSYFAPSTVS
jgi:hypothetical protein